MADDVITMTETTKWYKQTGVAKITSDAKYLGIVLNHLNGTAQFDDFVVAKLFDTEQAALDDALDWEKQRGEAFKAWNTEYEFLNTEMDGIISNATDPNELESQIKRSIEAVNVLNSVGKISEDVATANALAMTGYDDLSIAYDKFIESNTAEEVLQNYDELLLLRDQVFNYTLETSLISTPNFASNSYAGWKVKTGTYTGGDQRTNTVSGRTCWNAWWDVTATGGSGTTLGIYQQLDASSVFSGLYALECKALTQHYCETDQHAYLTNVTDDNQVESPVLPYGVMDLPQIDNASKWVTLVTPYIYVNDEDALTVGFTSSKEGAKDNTWVQYANPTSTDKREGWWCATAFQLRYIPAIKKQIEESGWATVCFRYAFNIPEGVKIYNIAGILKNQQYICLEEVSATRAGRPYVIMAPADEEITFMEYGKKSSMEGAYKGLNGIFVESGKYPAKSLILENGVFKYIPDVASSVAKQNYSAYITLSDLEVLDEWVEMMLPTSGLVDPTEIKISSSEDADSHSSDKAYDLSGKRANDNAKGIIIENGIKKVK
jgi:hypothetical protein